MSVFKKNLSFSVAISSAIALTNIANAQSFVSNGNLTYGVAATFAPFEFQENGKLTGLDIDMINAIAKQMKLSPVPMSMDFNGLIPALQGKRIDLINSGMYMNAKRAAQVDFVPYLQIGNMVVVAKSNPKKITGRDDSLCGKTIAVTLGGIEETYANEDVKRCISEGKAKVTVATYPTAQNSALALQQGRADAIFDSTPGTVVLEEKMPGIFKTVGEEFDAHTQIGYAFRKGDDVLKAQFTKALQAVVANGEYAKIIQKWNFPKSAALLTK